MRIDGKQVSGIYVETVLIPRPSEYKPRIDSEGVEVKDFQGKVIIEEIPKYYVFKFAAVLDFADFEKLVPEPKPPNKMLVGGKTIQNVEDSGYKEEISKWSLKRFNWTFLKSISATESLEWDKIKLDDPNTWDSIEDELKESGFSMSEIGRLYTGFHVANAMNEQKLEIARKHFLQVQRGQ